MVDKKLLKDQLFIKTAKAFNIHQKKRRQKKTKTTTTFCWHSFFLSPQKFATKKKKLPKIAPPGDLNLRDFSIFGVVKTLRRIIQHELTHKDQTPLDGAPNKILLNGPNGKFTSFSVGS